MDAKSKLDAPTPKEDMDVLAVQNLMRTQAQSTPDQRLSNRAEVLPDSDKGVGAPETQATIQRPPVASSKSAERQRRKSEVLPWLLRQVKNYRPNQRNIFWTSAVLLVLLRPAAVFGWTLFALFTLLLCYLFAGSDRFWRKVMSIFGWFSKRHPVPARKLKVRAYLAARKWDHLIQVLPQGLADFLHSPDLRGIVAADRLHDAALAGRLDRLRGDAVAR